MNTTKRIGKCAWRAGAALVCAIASVACVSQQQYDEAVANWKNEQNQRIAAQDRAAYLEEENSKLQALNRSETRKVLSAGYSDAMERLEELKRQFEERQSRGPTQDIERYELEGGYVFMIQDKVLFASGSAEITPEGKKALQGLADQINAKPHGRVLVRGHTDSDPVVKPATKERYPLGNLQLSAERSVSVGAFLIDSKVRAQDVVVAGYGQFEPVAANDSADNKRLNRRVEIFVADQ